MWTSLVDGSTGILSLMTTAIEIKIDSFRGYIYWRSRYRVYRSTLIGTNVTNIHSEDFFSERFGSFFSNNFDRILIIDIVVNIATLLIILVTIFPILTLIMTLIRISYTNYMIDC